jgi:hypothetical protein
MDDPSGSNGYWIALIAAGSALLGVLITGGISMAAKWLDYRNISALENRKIRLQKLEHLLELIIGCENLAAELYRTYIEWDLEVDQSGRDLIAADREINQKIDDVFPRLLALGHAYAKESFSRETSPQYINALQDFVIVLREEVANAVIDSKKVEDALEKVNHFGSVAVAEIAGLLQSHIS